MSTIVKPEVDDCVAVHLDATDDLPSANPDPVDNDDVVDANADVHAEMADNATSANPSTGTASQLPSTAGEVADDSPPPAAEETETVTPATTDQPAPQEQASAEAERHQRFCAVVEFIVPNKDMWSKVHQAPTDFFDADELPFEEKHCSGTFQTGSRRAGASQTR